MDVRAVSRLVLLVLFASSTFAHATPMLQATVGVVGGKGGAGGACGSLGTAAEAEFFAGSVFLVDRAGIASCGYSGSITTVTGTVGPVTNATSLAPVSVDFGNPAIQFDGTAKASAAPGVLRAEAHAHLVGGTVNGIALFNSMAIATFSDDVRAVSGVIPGGSDGFFRYRFRVDGSLSAPGASAAFEPGETFAALSIQQGTSGAFGFFSATVRRGSNNGSINNGPLPAGWVGGMGSLSGGSEFVTFDLPMVWGGSSVLKVGLMASAYGTADTMFGSTARLVGVEALDAARNPVSDFVLTSASGTNYLNLDGTSTAVPASQSVLMTLIGLIAVCAIRMRRRLSAN